MLVARGILNIELLLTHTLRTKEEQDALYAKGRTTKGEPPYTAERPLGSTVTNAKGGGSWHNHGMAFDVVPLKNGLPDWDASPVTWEAIGKLGESLGLEWGGRWKMRDLGHFQLRPAGFTSASAYSARSDTISVEAGDGAGAR